MDFPVLPPKGECDLGVLDSSEWTPTPSCFKCSADSASNLALASAGATCEFKHPDFVWGGGSRDCGKLLDGVNAWSSTHGRHMGYNERNVGREHFLIVTLPQPTAIREVKIHQARSWEVGNFTIETLDSSGAWVPQQHFAAPIADANIQIANTVVSTAVRMIGTPNRGNFGDFCYRMTEVEIFGCQQPTKPVVPLPGSSAGRYEVWYRDAKRSNTMTIDCNDAVSGNAGNEVIQFDDIATKCKFDRDADATMFIPNLHGRGKFECLKKVGDKIVGNHYTGPNSFWGTIEYRPIAGTRQAC